jgi:hypothetical protein
MEGAALKSSGTMKKQHGGCHISAGLHGTDPRKLLVPEEAGCRLQEGVLLCRSGMAQEKHRQE